MQRDNGTWVITQNRNKHPSIKINTAETKKYIKKDGEKRKQAIYTRWEKMQFLNKFENS